MPISKDAQGAYQRWEMTSFDEPRQGARRTGAGAAPAAAPVPAPVLPAGYSLPTLEEIEAMREAARLEGYAEGLAEGRAAGHAEGLESGHAEGHAGGHEEGLALGREEAAAETAQLKQLAATFADAVTAADDTIARDVLDLALHLAKNMVRTAFEVRPELILPVVRQAVDYLPSLQQPARLTLHPDDAAIVRASIGHELEKSGWRLVEDDQIARGGCRVDTASNQIDAQIAARWQRLTASLNANVDWLA
jgi:flagellar assembly protein FliH